VYQRITERGWLDEIEELQIHGVAVAGYR